MKNLFNRGKRRSDRLREMQDTQNVDDGGRRRRAAPSSDSLEGMTQPWDLLSLTPKYRKEEHGAYVDAIRAALGHDRIRNIALSGNYGVGKSSILQRVAELENRRVVEISLSTLAPIATKLDDKVPAQAATPTNRIQQEIVKQLLYREDPRRSPGSRFRRIERFRWSRELVLAPIIGFAVAVLFLLTGWGATLATTLQPVWDAGLWVYPAVMLLTTGAVVALRYLFHGRIHIKAFSAGPAAVTLDENSVSYFDQYLDEIVYFFESSPERDIVIFEDIDRFNDSHIFETLRSLNTLMNASPQISQRPIRFIYAIKDSIFDRIGLEGEGRKDKSSVDPTDPAQLETVRANRTKFFDLVIPVVPFITHLSARNLISQLLDGVENDVDPNLLDLAGRFVPDMRLLKNVRNEFIVFRDRIFAGEGKRLKLSETDLFAMMLYKSTHLTDFEKIRLGHSKLDKLYEAHRKLVTDNVKLLEQELRATRASLSHDQAMDRRAQALGQRLWAHITRTVRATPFRPQGAHYQLGDRTTTPEEMKEVSFWRELASSAASVVWRNSNSQTLTFTHGDLSEALGDPLDASAWEAVDRGALDDALHSIQENIAFLRKCDIGEVLKRPEFLVDFEKESRSLDAIAESLLARGLAFELARAGRLNRNFTLYTSTFHGDRVSAAATNFIILHVERGAPDFHFQLSGDDVDEVIRERGISALADPALFNIAILDRVLQSNPEAAEMMVSSLARLGETARQFLQAYLTAGEESTRFLELLTPKCSSVFQYLIESAELDDAVRVKFVNDALVSIPTGQKYGVNDAVRGFLRARWAELPVLTTSPASAQGAKNIAVLFAIAGVKLDNLSLLNKDTRAPFVDHGLYPITYDNLIAAFGEDADLALDTIHERNARAYDYLLGSFPAYLDAVRDRSETNRTEAAFLAHVEDVRDHAEAHIEEFIVRASNESTILDLSKAPQVAWPALARSDRFPATFANIACYIDGVGVLDQDLSVVLMGASTISETDGVDEAAKAKLAFTVLAARDLMDATVRVALVSSLGLKEYLDVSTIVPENSELFALLLQEDIVPDDADTFAHINAIEWKWLEQAIVASEQFVANMTPQLVGIRLGRILGSSAIDDEVKVSVLDNTAQFAQATNAEGRRALARCTLDHSRDMPIEVVEQLASETSDRSIIIKLLRPHLDALDDSRLFAILQAAGGAYAQLTALGRDKPRVNNTEEDQALLRSLKRRGIVSSYDPLQQPIVVNKHHGSRA